MSRKPKQPDPPAIEARKAFHLTPASGESTRRDVARMIVAPETAAARAIRATEGAHGLGEHLDVPELVNCLREQAATVNGGNMAQAEAALMNQATALQSLFARLIERGMSAEYMDHYETHLRLALRAQAQCRATLETLATIKNPPIIYARQANIANGPQQVNNGTAPHAQAPEKATEQSELLEANHAERLDCGAAQAPGRSNPALATVEAIDGTENRSR